MKYYAQRKTTAPRDGITYGLTHIIPYHLQTVIYQNASIVLYASETNSKFEETGVDRCLPSRHNNIQVLRNILIIACSNRASTLNGDRAHCYKIWYVLTSHTAACSIYIARLGPHNLGREVYGKVIDQTWFSQGRESQTLKDLRLGVHSLQEG